MKTTKQSFVRDCHFINLTDHQRWTQNNRIDHHEDYAQWLSTNPGNVKQIPFLSKTIVPS